MTSSRSLTATLAALAAVLLIASPASAAKVEVQVERLTGPASQLERLEVEDDAGEDNELSAHIIGESGGDFEVQVIDRLAALTPGPGCKGGGPPVSTVTCLMHKPGPERSVDFEFDLGGGHNFFEASNLPFSLAYLGGDGDDVVVAGLNGDTIDPGAGEDIVYGNPGPDLLLASAVPDAGNRYDLGVGFDTVTYAARTVPVQLRGATVAASGGVDRLEAVENVIGGAAGDAMVDEWLPGAFPTPTFARLEGGPGDDLLQGGVSGAAFVGGPGDDTLIGGDDPPVPVDLKGPPPRGVNRLIGEEGNDLAFGGNARDLIDLGAGDDTAYAGASNDRLDGGRGKDLLDGDEDDDLVIGDGGSDRLFGGSGEDRLFAARKVTGGSRPLTSGPYDGRDRVGCGPDRDRAFVNPWDTRRSCERVTLQPRPKRR